MPPALFIFAKESCYVTQAGLRLRILLPHPPEYWDYRSAPPNSAFAGVLMRSCWWSSLDYGELEEGLVSGLSKGKHCFPSQSSRVLPRAINVQGWRFSALLCLTTLFPRLSLPCIWGSQLGSLQAWSLCYVLSGCWLY
jgi:hypothetical protein